MAQEAAGRPPEETLSLWKREQARLKALLVDRDTEAWQRDPAFAGLHRVGGVDVSFVKGDSVRACASLVVLSFPELEVVYEESQMVNLTAPYVAGFLAFREVPFLVDLVRRLQEKEPGLMPQAGSPCGWKWGAPPPRLWGGLPPGRPHRAALRWGGQETPAGGWTGEQCPAQGKDPAPAGWRRYISSDRWLWDCPGNGPEEPQPQHQASLHLRGPQDQPGGGRAPSPTLLQVPDPRARAPDCRPHCRDSAANVQDVQICLFGLQLPVCYQAFGRSWERGLHLRPCLLQPSPRNCCLLLPISPLLGCVACAGRMEVDGGSHTQPGCSDLTRENPGDSLRGPQPQTSGLCYPRLALS
ncbi:endonuclease V isoform X2 [Sciurus carolinensis]|uniref:endonuclease V isoform X2 n=1 Tax=Sciurus carolinensis TaxID=30640 RepID=UPI001FB45E78|nr:endonuclease V isoform X2 [Sciurus carolinensis]XP_047401159.1 endonuclease V isoform X2 [Sciurus carolinensis]